MIITDQIHGFLWEHPSVNNCNTYLINGASPILIDPGHRHGFDHVVSGLWQLGLEVADLKLVLCTHAHPDHMEAVPAAAAGPSTLFAIHPEDWRMAREMARQLGIDIGDALGVIEPDFFLSEGDLQVDGEALTVIHTPGHSPGGVVIHHPASGALFAGDLIFAEGIGRTDLPGGDAGLLKESIRRLKSLSVTHLLPGHGPVVRDPTAVQKCLERAETVWLGYI